jgi:hypothetical protein
MRKEPDEWLPVTITIGYENGPSSPACIRVAACISDYPSAFNIAGALTRIQPHYPAMRLPKDAPPGTWMAPSRNPSRAAATAILAWA